MNVVTLIMCSENIIRMPEKISKLLFYCLSQYGEHNYMALAEAKNEGMEYSTVSMSKLSDYLLLNLNSIKLLDDFNLLWVHYFTVIMLFVSNLSLLILFYILFKRNRKKGNLPKGQSVDLSPEMAFNNARNFDLKALGYDHTLMHFDYDSLNIPENRKHLMLQMNLRADDKWEMFQKWFNELFPDFYLNLSNRFPELTPSDYRLLSLMKLNLKNKDMALRLGISIEGVKKSKQRLRKKLNIDLYAVLEDEPVS